MASPEQTIKRLKRVIRDFEPLDDPSWIFRNDRRKVLRFVEAYKARLNAVFFNLIPSETITDIIGDAISDFAGAMQRFKPGKYLLSQQNKKALSNAIALQYFSQTQSVVQKITSMQMQKKLVGDVRIDAQSLIDAKLIELDARLGTLTINRRNRDGEIIETVNLTDRGAKNIWDDLTENFGNHDQIVFTGAKRTVKQPLITYTEGRLQTTEAEIHRITTAFSAARHEILTGKVSRHNAQDSCRFFEGEIIFFSNAAKQIFLKENPDAPVKRWRTLQELERNETHIFKFRCKHLVTPWPINFFNPETQAKDITENNKLKASRPIPSKINEGKIEREIRAGELK